MRILNEVAHEKRKVEIMEKAFECYAEYGLNNVGLKKLGKYCGMASGVIYSYFDNLDDLIVQACEHCMSKIEDDFMNQAPVDANDIFRFIDEIPYWTAQNHGKKYRLMYEIYTDPKYVESGKKFFEGVNKRYLEYAKTLEAKLGLDHTVILSFIFILVRASVHYALFKDEYYLKMQLDVIKQSLTMFVEKEKSYATNSKK